MNLILRKKELGLLEELTIRESWRVESGDIGSKSGYNLTFEMNLKNVASTDHVTDPDIRVFPGRVSWAIKRLLTPAPALWHSQRYPHHPDLLIFTSICPQMPRLDTLLSAKSIRISVMQQCFYFYRHINLWWLKDIFYVPVKDSSRCQQ